MSTDEGRKFLPKVWNLFPKPLTDEDFFVEPWNNREHRDCAEFRLGTGRNGSDEILFFVSDTETVDFLKKATSELFVFGAYNQIDVCQMRARGTVTLDENHPEAEQIKLRRQAAITIRVGSFLNKLDEKEAAERYAILDQGLLFCFRVNSYAYHMYERG